MKKKFCALLAVCALSSVALAADAVKLPAPEKSGGMALLDALSARRSARDFADVKLTEQQLSNLLWATGGVSDESGKMTYPTAKDVRDLQIYAFTADGVYRYNPAGNELISVLEGDHRAESGVQPYVAAAAVNLLYVQDATRWGERSAQSAAVMTAGAFHAGEAAQNAALYATSQGWGSVVRMSFNGKSLSDLLGLDKDHFCLLAQSIGPKK